MIARVWRGATRAADEQAYAEYLEQTGMRSGEGASRQPRDPRASPPGRRPRRVPDGAAVRVAREHVRAFAGDEIERAVFFPEDDRFLVEREPAVAHYDVDYAA